MNIDRRGATHIRGHIGHDHLNLTLAYSFQQRLQHQFITKIALKEIDANDRIHWQNITGDDAPGTADLGDHILRPAARCGTESTTVMPGEQFVALLYFIKFKPGRANAVLFLRLLYIFIAKVFL